MMKRLYTKREFLTIFGATLAAVKSVRAQMLLTGVGTYPSSGLAEYNGFASTRGYIPSNLLAATGVNTRSGHWARDDISEVSIKFPNFYGQSETPTGNDIDVFASFEFPAGTVQQFLFGSSAMGTAADGDWLDSDVLTLADTVPCGNRYWIRLFLQAASFMPYMAGIYYDPDSRYMGDAFDISATDLTMMGSVAVPATEQIGFIPTVISPTTYPSVLALGDSNFYGVSDLMDISGDLGIIARSIGHNFGYANWSMPGEAVSGFLANHTNRIMGLANCTHVYCGWITNDVFASDSAATIEANLASAWALCTGKTVYQVTAPPRTDSTDDWVTTGNQSIVSAPKEAVREAVNTYIVANPPGGGTDDAAAVVTTMTELWVPDKTIDGIHYAKAGALDVVSSLVIDPASIGASAPVTDTGSAWGDSGTKITVGTLYRTNDMAYANTGGNPNTSVRGAQGRNSGLLSFEVELLAATTPIFGLMTIATGAGAGLDSYCGDIPDSFGLANGAAYNFVSGTIFSPTSVGSFVGLCNAGDVWGFDVDFTNKFAYLRRNGVYFLGGDPASGAMGTGNVCSWTGTPTLYPGITLYGYVSSNVAVFPVRIRTVQLLHDLPMGGAVWG